MLQEVLEDAGYETLVAANGRQALAHIEKESEVIDLVITDARRFTADSMNIAPTACPAYSAPTYIELCHPSTTLSQPSTKNHPQFFPSGGSNT